MATPVLKPEIDPEKSKVRGKIATVPAEAAPVQLPEYADLNVQREILDALPVLVFLERAGKVVFANAEARQMLGLAEEDWNECPVEDVLWGLYPGTAEPQTLLTGTRKGSPFHATMPSKNGRLVPVEGTYCILSAEQREAVIIGHPAGRERAPRSRLLEDVLASIPEAVAIEHSNHVLYTNPAFTRMFGYTPEEAGGGSLRQLIVPETRFNEHATLEKTVDEQGRAMVETVRANRDGVLVDVSMQISPLLVDGARVGYVFTFRDIGERRQAEVRLEHDAMHDVLTGLPNRALFLDRLTLALSRRARNPEKTCGVLYVDLDRFKEMNDALGHAAGDVLLLGMAERLSVALRPQDSAARLGGDEFAVLVEEIQGADDLEAVAKRIRTEMERPFDIFGHLVQAGASIGAAMAGAEHTSSDLMHEADTAMYIAKRAGGGRYEIFDKRVELAITSRQEREWYLRQVVENRLFEFRFQPVFRLMDGRLESLDSVLYRRLADGRMETLGDLAALAEETGLSLALGRETMEGVYRLLRQWSESLPETPITAGVSLTHRQFYHPEMIAQLKAALQASGVAPGQVLLQVPENVLNEDPDAAAAIVHRIAHCQVRFAVDEFGSSLAPLNHLMRLPIDMVKLSPKLAAIATSQNRQRKVLEVLIQLCGSLGVQVVAKGIETPDQLRALGLMGCTMGQGELLSMTLDPARALKAIQTGYWVFAHGA